MNHAESLPSQPPITVDEVQVLAKELEGLKNQILEIANRLRGRSGVEQRWLAIGVTDVEKGMMAMGHAITKEILEKLRGDFDAMTSDGKA
ncbi:MAG: hypothetical protein ACK46Q_17000 [Hyphomonas sp.]